MKYSQSHPEPKSCVVSALYRKAASLEAAWRNARLADDFGGRMIDAVLEFASRRGIELEPRSAQLFLQKFWDRNARRDAGRRSQAPRHVSIDDVEVSAEPHEPSGLPVILSTCTAILSRYSIRPEVSTAYLLDALNEEQDDVLDAIEFEHGIALSPATLRQWKHRYFPRVAEILRQNFDLTGLSYPLSHFSAVVGIDGSEAKK